MGPAAAAFWALRALAWALAWALVSGDEAGVKCGGGDPCIFMDRNQGWIRWHKPTWEHKPPPPKSDSWQRPDSTIYLTIASFRDKLCPMTLYNLFSKAKHPERIFPGVVQQNVEGTDMDCLDTYCLLVEDFGLGNYSAPSGGGGGGSGPLDAILSDHSVYKPGAVGGRRRQPGAGPVCPFEANVRMDRVDARIAQGPTWARARGSLLLRDEEFCMQTDAHMDFVQHWDLRMLETWAATNNEYAILSTYVAPTEQLRFNEGEGARGLNALHEVPHLCMVTLFGSHELPRIWGTKCARSLPEPKLTNGIWGAGLSFSKCHAERKAPYDPHTPQIFDGEEFSRSIRFWTWGYDIYTPHRVYVVHNYHVSQSDPTHFDWARNAVGTGETSAVRIKTLIAAPGGQTDPTVAAALRRSRYGLGDRRSLDQYIEFSGIDTHNRKILGNRCGNIDFVPFQEHPFGPDYVPAFSPETEAPLDPADPGSVHFDAAKDAAQWEAFARKPRPSSSLSSSSSSSSSSSPRIAAALGGAGGASVAAFGATLRRGADSADAHAKAGGGAGGGGAAATAAAASSGGNGGGEVGLAQLAASSRVSPSDAILLGITLAGIVGTALYALLCRRHFASNILMARKGGEASKFV